MPTILRVDGFRFYFYSHEPNEPPHVHIDKDAATAKVWLHDATVARSMGFSAQDLGKIQREHIKDTHVNKIATKILKGHPL